MSPVTALWPSNVPSAMLTWTGYPPPRGIAFDLVLELFAIALMMACFTWFLSGVPAQGE
jgi:hypothetical protein